MKAYFKFSYYRLLHIFRKYGNPSYSASIGLAFIWGVDILYLLKLFSFGEEKSTNTISLGIVFIISLIIFLGFWKNENLYSKKEERNYPKLYKPMFFIQVYLTLAGFGWYILKYLFI